MSIFTEKSELLFYCRENMGNLQFMTTNCRNAYFKIKIKQIWIRIIYIYMYMFHISFTFTQHHDANHLRANQNRSKLSLGETCVSAKRPIANYLVVYHNWPPVIV